MMKSILSKLYNGEVYPAEQAVTTDLKFRLLSKKISDEFDCLKEKVNKEDADRLEQLKLSCCESTSTSNCTNFTYGYRLGVLTMIEIFTANDKLINRDEA